MSDTRTGQGSKPEKPEPPRGFIASESYLRPKPGRSTDLEITEAIRKVNAWGAQMSASRLFRSNQFQAEDEEALKKIGSDLWRALCDERNLWKRSAGINALR